MIGYTVADAMRAPEISSASRAGKSVRCKNRCTTSASATKSASGMARNRATSAAWSMTVSRGAWKKILKSLSNLAAQYRSPSQQADFTGVVMGANGHVARARNLGLIANRTLVRNIVQLMLRAPGVPIYIYYDRRHRRMYATAVRPLHGVWRQVGPHDMGTITLIDLAREIEYLAQACREHAA